MAVSQKRRRAASEAGQQPLISVKKSSVCGKGAFARRDIPKGERIIEYKGKRRKWSTCLDDGDAYVYFFGVGKDMVIDPFIGGNEARFINHSCAPNCRAVEESGRIYIESMRPIKKGEELFYDYSLRLGRRPTEEDIRRYACHCGSPNCRGTMLKLPRLGPHKKATRA
jgi:hypothetical protein